MVKIKIEKELRDCQDCPCCGDKYGGGDTTTYFCEALENKPTIAYQVEYRSEMPSVPKWCPYRVKE